MSKKYNIYLDNASTTEPYDDLCSTERIWGNASSLHDIGIKASEYLEKSKKIISNIFNTDKNSILFTSGATEGNNLVIQSIINQKLLENREYGVTELPHVICSPIEHPSVKNIIEHYVDLKLIECDYIPVFKDGTIRLDKIKELIKKNTCIVTCMYVNNEIGSIQDINLIGKICEENNIPFHVDATQAVGKIEIDLQKDNIDYLVFSAHKFHGPKGVGAIICKDNYMMNLLKICPLFFGGHQQSGIRSGTEDVEKIYQMAKVLKLIYESIEETQKETIKYNMLLEDLFSTECFENNINMTINSYYYSIPVFNISFKGVSGDYLVSELNNLGIYISTGSACTSGELDPSYVLQVIGVPDDYINGTIRISFDPYDDNLENKLKDVVKEIINLIK